MSMRPGSREWRAKFDRDRRSFDRMWPWAVGLSIVGAILALAAIVTGILVAWHLWL